MTLIHPAAVISGRVEIGEGTVVSNNVSICNNCMIGAGAVVVKDALETGTYIGVLAVIRRERSEKNISGRNGCCAAK